VRDKADGSLAGLVDEGVSADTIDDPFKDTGVMPEPGPQIMSSGALLEKVCEEDSGGLGELSADLVPVGPIVAHVASAKDSHG
jgi:hypothetical protein